METDHQPYGEEESRGDKVLRGLTFRKATLKEFILPSGREPQNVNMISKYEKAWVIGVRATQIANGVRPKCSTESLTKSLDIATREFEQGLTPYVFKRRIGAGTEEGIYSDKSVEGASFGKERKGQGDQGPSSETFRFVGGRGKMSFLKQSSRGTNERCR